MLQAILKGCRTILSTYQCYVVVRFDYSTEADAYEKPNPKVLSPLFEEYNVDPQKVAIVGDTANDMKTASNANLGMAIGVLTGIATKEELHEADIILNSAADILEALN